MSFQCLPAPIIVADFTGAAMAIPGGGVITIYTGAWTLNDAMTGTAADWISGTDLKVPVGGWLSWQGSIAWSGVAAGGIYRATTFAGTVGGGSLGPCAAAWPLGDPFLLVDFQSAPSVGIYRLEAKQDGGGPLTMQPNLTVFVYPQTF